MIPRSLISFTVGVYLQQGYWIFIAMVTTIYISIPTAGVLDIRHCGIYVGTTKCCGIILFWLGLASKVFRVEINMSLMLV